MLLVVLFELYGAPSTVRKLGNTCGDPVVKVKGESAVRDCFISGRFGVNTG
jgi:hypothetical protein